MSRKRRQFSGSFKAKLALAAIKGERTVAQLASEHQVHPNQISQWRKQLLDVSSEVFSCSRKTACKDEADQTSALYKQIGRLQMELA